MPVKKKITFDGYETRDKTVHPIGNSAHVMVPKAWIGKRVTIVLLEDLEEK